MMCRTEEYLEVLNLGGRFACTNSFGGLKTSLPRNLLRTFTQVVNILETNETEIGNLSANLHLVTHDGLKSMSIANRP